MEPMADGVEAPELLAHRLIRRALNTELAIGALEAIGILRKQLEELEDRAIATAREKGASWADIADALGITRQALQQRVARRALAAKSRPRL